MPVQSVRLHVWFFSQTLSCRFPYSTSKTDIGETYTKDEVDLLLSKLNSEIRYEEGSITYDMLARLNKCTIIKDNQQSGVISCNEVCKKTVKESVCVLGEYSGTITSCSDSTGSINTDRFCKCCGL